MVVETAQVSTADDRECWKAEGSAKLLRMEGLASWEEGILWHVRPRHYGSLSPDDCCYLLPGRFLRADFCAAPEVPRQRMPRSSQAC